MELTRRDVIKLWALGAVDKAATAKFPWGAMIGAKAASQLAPRDMPRPFP